MPDWGNVTVAELRAGVGFLRVECLSGHRGVVEEAYTTNLGTRWHALVAFDSGGKGPCLLSNLRREAAHRPQRGDDVEAWLKRMRDRYPRVSTEWSTANRILDRYRECSDYGLTLQSSDDGAGDP